MYNPGPGAPRPRRDTSRAPVGYVGTGLPVRTRRVRTNQGGDVVPVLIDILAKRRALLPAI